MTTTIETLRTLRTARLEAYAIAGVHAKTFRESLPFTEKRSNASKACDAADLVYEKASDAYRAAKKAATPEVLEAWRAIVLAEMLAKKMAAGMSEEDARDELGMIESIG